MQESFVTEDEIEKTWRILRETGAFLEGHFVIPPASSHYTQFFQIPLAMQHSAYARILCVAIGRVMRRSGILRRLDPERRFTVIAPEDAGISVAFWFGEHLEADRILWVRSTDDGWRLRHFINIDEKDQVILVDDAILTGETVEEVIKFVERKGASVVAVASIVDRRDGENKIGGVPVFSILTVPSSKYDPAKCPACESGEKLTEIKLR